MTDQSIVEIDFLPADFHLRRRKRSARRFRGTLCALFLGLIGIGLVANRIQHQRLVSHHQRLEPEASAVSQLDQQLEGLRLKITRSRYQADLWAHLQLQPAATRILAVVTGALPPDVALKSVRLNTRVPIQAVNEAEVKGLEKGTPHEIDLLRVVREAEQRHRMFTVEGIAPDDKAIADYLTKIRQSEFFDEIQLLYTDNHLHRGHELRTFAAELRLRKIDSGSPRPDPTETLALLRGGRRR